MKRAAIFIAKEVFSYFAIAVVLYSLGVIAWHYVHMLTGWESADVLRFLGWLLVAFTLGAYAGKVNNFIWARFKGTAIK